MKKSTLFLSIVGLFILSQLSCQINMNSNGEVGIGASAVTGIDFFTPEAKITTLGVGANPLAGIDFYTPEAKITTLGVGVSPSSTYDFYTDHAQINRLRVGTGASNSFCELEIDGEVEIQVYYASALEFGWVNYNTSMFPTSNNNGYVGYSSKAFKAMYAYDYYDISDERQKENIHNITGALEIIKNLQGVKYDLKKEYAYSDTVDDKLKERLEIERKNKIGFLAQDVFTQLPEVVHYNDTLDIYSMSYNRIIPVLVEALKEQQVLIEELQNELDEVKQQSNLKSLSINDENDEVSDMPILYQNSPNPFSENTIIRYFLPESVNNAFINVYDVKGKQLKSISLVADGESQISISSGELQPGMFMYILIADGIIVDTKSMILTD